MKSGSSSSSSLFSLVKTSHESSKQVQPIYIYCSKEDKIIIGRGPDVTIKIGKGNKKVSREHVVIEYKSDLKLYEMTVLSPNGVLVDHIVFMKGEHIPLLEDTLIEIVGNKLIFKEQHTVKQEPLQQPSPTTHIITQQQPSTPSPTTTITTTTTKKKTTTTTATINTTTTTTTSTIPPPKKPLSLEDEIIQILACTRKSTMTCTDITKKLQSEYSTLSISKILNNSNMIGCIKRLGKTADGSPKENLYYYKADMDSNPERKRKYMDTGRSARKCTMKDTQYFFKIPPKLPNHSKVKKKTTTTPSNSKLIEEVESIASSDDDISDMEVFELFKDI